MTPEEYIIIVKRQEEIMLTARTVMLDARLKADKAPWPSNERKALPSDIIEGSIIWHKNGDDGPFWNIVEEVLYPNDAFKAHLADDGCRYGLDEAFVRA